MKKKLRQGFGMVIYTALVLSILVVVNAISFSHYKLFDITGERIFTLSDQSRKVAESLKENVTIYAFDKPMRFPKIREFLDRYTYVSKKIRYEIIDPDKKPGMAKKFKVIDYGSFVIQTASGRVESAKKMSEDEITNTIVKATTARQKKIYILTGHDERDIANLKPLGWSGAKKELESAMYKVTTLNWFSLGKIPDDSDLLIIPGPRNDLQEGEINRLSEYMEKGGNVMLTVDPSNLPNLQHLLGEYGFIFYNDIILDPLSQKMGFDPMVATVSSYDNHPITKDFKAATFYPVARSLGLKPSNSKNANVKPIGRTTKQSWSETDLKSIEDSAPVYSESDDMPGPRIVAASAQWDIGPSRQEREIGEKNRHARMIVTGDSDFVSNSTVSLLGNRDMFLNMVAWLLDEDVRISIRPKTRGFNPIFFTSGQLTFIFWSVVVAIPLIVGFAGVIVIFRRRKG